MTRRAKKGVPALRNEDVTGMTQDREDQIIRESGRAPRAGAAEEFLDEQQEQAAATEPSADEDSARE
jgi:hypothetical protein